MTDHAPQGEHEWVARINDDGDLYEVCVTCGKQGHWMPLPEGAEVQGPQHPA